MMRLCSMAMLLVLVAAGGASAADEWGDLTLRVTFDGVPPKPRLIENDRDPKVCGTSVRDESLVVNDEDQGIANVALWLLPSKGQAVREHESLKKQNSDPTIIVKNCRYEPRIVLMQPPGTLRFRNMDPLGFNPVTRFFEDENPPTSSTIPGEHTIQISVNVEEHEPIKIYCNIHPWMRTWLLLRDTPYMAVSDTSGKVTIKNLPAGKWNFRLWHERVRFINTGTLNGKDVEWSGGRVQWEIMAGNNELGELKLKPEAFK